ncbi:MAG: tyrosine-type recombinase/integrase [Phycisphaerales bacterium]
MSRNTPPKPKRKRTPKYRRQRRRDGADRAFVELDGRRVYLGAFDDPASLEKYHRVVAEWLAGGGHASVVRSTTTSTDLTVIELIDRFWTERVDPYYRDADGKPTSEVAVMRSALRPLRKLYSRAPAIEFGPLALKAVRQDMIDRGWSRLTINRSVDRIRMMFKWAVAHELLPSTVHESLRAVEGLRKGRSEAPEPDPVQTVPQAHIEAVHPFVSRQVWAMIELQLLTGARPGEVVEMRPVDLDTTGSIWTYTPRRHKTEHHGHRRVVYIGPRAQAVIEPFMSDRAVDAFMFSPADAEAERLEARHTERDTPLNEGNRPGSNRSKRPRWTPGESYTVESYRRAIVRACEQAFPPPPELARGRVETGRGRGRRETDREWKARLGDRWGDLLAWRREHRWHPHQLRHNAATNLRREFSVDVARVILGHRTAKITESYAELDEAKALEAMKLVG